MHTCFYVWESKDDWGSESAIMWVSGLKSGVRLGTHTLSAESPPGPRKSVLESQTSGDPSFRKSG